MADDDSCIKCSEFCYRCLCCSCLSASTKAVLASWFFAILNFTILVYVCVQKTNGYASDPEYSKFGFSYEVGYPVALVGLLLSMSSIYGVHSRNNGYMRPFAIYLLILGTAGLILMFISGKKLKDGNDPTVLLPILITSILIAALTLSSVFDVWNPWDDYEETPQRPSRIREPVVKYRRQPRTPSPYLRSLPAIEHPEKPMILPTHFPTKAHLPMLGQ